MKLTKTGFLKKPGFLNETLEKAPYETTCEHARFIFC